jgi:hypothetical protein
MRTRRAVTWFASSASSRLLATIVAHVDALFGVWLTSAPANALARPRDAENEDAKRCACERVCAVVDVHDVCLQCRRQWTRRAVARRTELAIAESGCACCDRVDDIDDTGRTEREHVGVVTVDVIVVVDESHIVAAEQVDDGAQCVCRAHHVDVGAVDC